MPVEFWQGRPFDKEHEVRAQETVIKNFGEMYSNGDAPFVLVFNFLIGDNNQIDLLILKRNGIIVVDFKECDNPLVATINKKWKILGTEKCPFGNPFEQIYGFRFAIMNELSGKRMKFLERQKALQAKFDHVSGVIAVSPSLHPKTDQTDINPKIYMWFRLVGLDNLHQEVARLSSPQFLFEHGELRDIVEKVIGCDTQISAPHPPPIAPAIVQNKEFSLPQTEREKQLPDLDSEASPMVYDVKPASKDDICGAATLAKRVYGGDDVIPESVMLEWHEVNPCGFSVITFGDKLIGNLDILPLKPYTLKRFEQGLLLEKHITGDGLFSERESDQIRDLYIESFVCPNDRMGVVVTLSQFDSIVQRLCPTTQINRVLAIAASPSGQNILKHLGFEITGNAQGHDLFSVMYSTMLPRIDVVVDRILASIQKRAGRRSDNDQHGATDVPTGS